MIKDLRKAIVDFLSGYNITKEIMQDRVKFARALGFDVYNADPKANLQWVCSVVEDPEVFIRESLGTLKSKKNIMFYNVSPEDARSILLDEIAYYIYMKLYINDKPSYAHINGDHIKNNHRLETLDIREVLQNLEICGITI